MIYIVTGISKGLGLAIAELYLSKGHTVIGIGRRHAIRHENFTFIELDLGDIEAVKNVTLPQFSEPVTLINNAGVIGDIERMSQQEELDLATVLTINTIAPQFLTLSVYKRITNKSDFTLVNISSGAANRAIPSWASYCASKAALNMYSETFFLEEKELGNNCKVYCVAPGVIDTDMQDTIRSASEMSFSSHANFVTMKSEGELMSAAEVALKLDYLLGLPYSGEVFYDVRDF